jgi:hypothetical protein
MDVMDFNGEEHRGVTTVADVTKITTVEGPFCL